MGAAHGDGQPLVVAMSGGVDSAVCALAAVEAGFAVTGVTLRLLADDPGDLASCCGLDDAADARAVCARLGIPHEVWNLAADFERAVIDDYVEAHATGRTPNPCVRCNAEVKFAALLARVRAEGARLATGHHVRLEPGPRPTLRRGLDRAKDQSYVLWMLTAQHLAHLWFPVGTMTKQQVRARAAAAGLPVAAKPESQDACFVTAAGGRRAFLGPRTGWTPGVAVDAGGRRLGTVEALELVTVGQRRGLGLAGGAGRRYAVAVDLPRRRVVVGDAEDLQTRTLEVEGCSWVHEVPTGAVRVQGSAHGRSVAATLEPIERRSLPDRVRVRFAEPTRRIAPGQSVAVYAPDDDEVLGGGTVRLGADDEATG